MDTDDFREDNMTEMTQAMLERDAEAHERAITHGFDEDQLDEGDPCYRSPVEVLGAVTAAITASSSSNSFFAGIESATKAGEIARYRPTSI